MALTEEQINSYTRSLGRTTRQVDSSIQALFGNVDKAIAVKDHFYSDMPDAERHTSTAFLVSLIENRLKNEHGILSNNTTESNSRFWLNISPESEDNVIHLTLYHKRQEPVQLIDS